MPSNCSLCEASCKIKKYLHLGQKILYLGIFQLEFEKAIVIFEISALKFVWLQIWQKKQKCLNLKPKMSDLGICGLEFEKKYCHIWNQHLRICLIEKYRERTKMPKIGTKNALFGYFWPKKPYLDTFELEF